MDVIGEVLWTLTAWAVVILCAIAGALAVYEVCGG